MAAWMLHALLVSAALSVAAWASDAALRLQRLPARWVWASALAASLLLPAFGPVRPQLPAETPSATAPGSDAGRTAFPPWLDGVQASAAALEAWTPTLSALWGGLTLAAVGLFALGSRHLARRRRRWERAEVLGRAVRVSRSFGPAVAGVLRPEVVLPRWMLELEAEDIRLALLHEGEHARSRDTLLLAAGYLAAAAAAWNPLLWWQLRRLGMAVELDCDLRVLSRGASPCRYGALLLAVGERSSGAALAPALSRPTSFLKRRMTLITASDAVRGRPLRTTAAAALALGMAAVACDLPQPTTPGAPPPAEAAFVPLEERAAVRIPIRLPEDGRDRPAPPLIYVDGVLQQTGAGALPDELRPEDILRIEVVRGGAAEEIWGPEAASGVVQIFTKAGREGR